MYKKIDKINDFTNIFILEMLSLPVIYDLKSFSNRIGLSKRILYLLSSNSKKYYSQFKIPKSNGKDYRVIDSPKYSMKLVQRWILKEVLEKLPVSSDAMAFKPGAGNGAKHNAKIHSGKLYSLVLDLENFFQSIHGSRIYYLFKSLGYNVTISTILTNLCTLEGSLPQGGVCSPYLSNLVCIKLDKRMRGLCSKRDIVYSRYADDLTFSSDNKVVLKKVYYIIKEIISDEGFLVNEKKTRFLSPSSHKAITGITVNNKELKANKSIKRKVRTMIHNSTVSCDYSQNDVIRGYVSYINSIEEGYKDKIIDYINRLKEKDYKHDKELVKQFNLNKLYKEVKDMEYQEVPYGSEDEIDYFTNRYYYLLERGLIEDEDLEIDQSNELETLF